MRISSAAKVGAFALLTFCLLIVSPGLAQQTSGVISGVVQDVQGAVVPGAIVTLINQAQGGTYRQLESSAEGNFVITPVPPGTYTVTVEKPGFKKYTQKDITLFAQSRIGLPPIKLDIGAVGESVTVEASSVMLQTVSAERSGVITGTQIVDLASSGRAFTDLLKTVPGFNPDTNNANGLRVDQNALMVDGISTMDAGNNGTGLMRLNSDLIAEFKVLTNGQQAEFGRAAGANITVVTKSGSRDFHGGAYLFLQNESMSANSWLNNYNKRPRALNRRRTQGFNIGGPVYIPGKFNSSKDKLFFFTNFEFQRPRVFDTLQNRTVPTAAQLTGDFSQTQENGKPVTIKDPTTGLPFANNIIPTDRINKYGLELLTLMPRPNSVGDNAYNYQYQFAGTEKIDDRIFRGDWNISDNWKFYGRIIQNHRVRNQQAGLNVNNVIGISGFDADNGALAGSGTLTTIISPTLTNEFSHGNTRNWLPNVPPSDSKYLRANSGVTLPLLYPNGDPAGVIPNMTWDVPNAPTIYIAGMPYDNENPSRNWTDNLAKVQGNHTMKFGLFIETVFKRQTATIVNAGRIDFSRDSANPGDTGWAFSNALLGNYKTFEQSNNYRKGYYRYQTYEWYAQDNWKIKSNLSMDFGVRFSLIKPWYDDKDQVSSLRLADYDPAKRVTLYRPTLVGGKRMALNPLTNETSPAALIGAIVSGSGDPFNGIVSAGKNGVPRGMIDSQGVVFGPRFGLAWTPAGVTGKTVVRMGGGVFYERIQGNMIFNQINYPPGLVTPKIYYGNLSDISKASGTLFPLNIAGLSPKGQLPTVYNYNLSIQRELPGKFLLDVGYVGTLTRHGLARMPFNEAPFGSAWLPQNQDPASTSSSTVPGDKALPVDFLRPYTGYAGAGTAVAQSGLGGGGFIATYDSSTNYNGLQISANRRMAKDLTIGANYTWGKTLGTDTDFQYAGHFIDHRKADYGLLIFDRTQSLVVNYIYTVPGIARKGTALDNPVFKVLLNGWQVSGITSLSSGAPMTVGGGTSVSANGSYSVQGVGASAYNRQITGSEGWSPRPVLTCNPNLSPGSRTLASFIDTTCFQPAAVGSMGMDSGVRPFRGPGVNNWDISLFKNIPLGIDAQRYIQLRFETYNAWNHTQFSSFNFTPTFDKNTGKITNLSSLVGGGGGRFGFGAPNAVRAARSIQIAGKIYF